MSLLSVLLKICCGGSQSPEQTELQQPQEQPPSRPYTQQPQAHPEPDAHGPQQGNKQHHKHKPHKPPQGQASAGHEEYPPLGAPSSSPPPAAHRPPQQDAGAWQEVKPEHKAHPQHAAHSPSPPPPHRPAQGPRHYSDANQINQHNEHYMRMRADANAEGDKMAKCFAESHEAYSRGDGAGAKQLSNEGKEHQAKMNALNKQASDWIFIGQCTDSHPGEIDLHGLYVKEAIEHTDRALQEAKQRGDSEIHLIVGKGLHSQGHVAKIKPAIEELHQLYAELDPHNAGVLICKLDNAQGGVGSDEIARRLERDDEGCTIM
ncbi:hypothetical protein B0H14DRAFT_2668254 [Mycena olivaceomarginata]|nr:hypothetical protein B0H14DRAFT_2668254 [Mycena olivaceomarginata]